MADNVAEKATNSKFARSSIVTTDAFFNDVWTPKDVDKLEVFDIKQYEKVVKECRYFYRVDPIASTVVNKLVEIGITDLLFDKNNLSDNIFRIYEGLSDEIREFIEACALEYLVTGMVIPEVEYEAVRESKIKEMGIKKTSTLVLPTNMWLRDPATIKIKYTIVLDKPSYFVKLPEEFIFFVLNKGVYADGNEDKELYAEILRLYPDLVEKIKSGIREVPLENKLVLRRKPLSDSPYPLPYLYPALESLRHKRNIRRMDYSLASRAIEAIQLIRYGDADFPLTEENQDDLNHIREQMSWKQSAGRYKERIFQLFSNHTLDISWVLPPLDALVDNKKYETVDQDIFFALGFPRILTTGESMRTGTSDPEFASLSPMRTMENLQKRMIKIVRKIVREIADKNSLKDYPDVRFAKINLLKFEDFINSIQYLYDSGNLSRDSYTELFGYNFQDEIEKRSEEEKKLEEMGVPAFAPKPFSPNPEVPNENPENTKNTEQNTKQ